jgi:hypothetical protein
MVLALLLGAIPAAAAGTQAPTAPPAGDGMISVDPIRCWWRTSAGAVHVGEAFTVALTCAVIDADGVEVVPDETRLSDSVIQMSPFEVVGGSHPPDLRSGQRRFFQYHYVLQAINPDVIGRDVPLPPLEIRYRINSELPGNAAVQGRELSYILPPHTVRVVSMVADRAPDIRDAPDAAFARIEALSFRAGVFEIAAAAFGALGALTIVAALVGVRRTHRKEKPSEPGIGDRAVLDLAARELAAVRREADTHGWSEPLVGRTLAALRLTAASALDRPVSQRFADAAARPGEGRLLYRRPLRPGASAVLSSAVTAEAVAREIKRLPADSDRRGLLDRLRETMNTLAAAQYGPTAPLDRESLDAALAEGLALTRRLRSERGWLRVQGRRLASRAARVGARA